MKNVTVYWVGGDRGVLLIEKEEGLKMENYLYREIAEASVDGLMTVSRHRNTNGVCSILIKVKEKKDDEKPQWISFTSKPHQTEGEIMTGDDPDEYERRAEELGNMIQRVVRDKCELPGQAEPERERL